jgi:hypothetical protein
MTARNFIRAHTRKWVPAGVGLLILTGITIVLWPAGSWPRARKPGIASASQTTSAAPDEIQSLGTRARQAARVGRLDAAFELYRRLESSHWTAEDGFTLANALLQRDRLVLGWTALEAARRIDPKHAKTLRALDGIQAEVAGATGAERTRLHEAARRVELLRAISGGPPLGLVALGMARFAANSDQEDAFFHRLGVRDRSALRNVSSVMTATGLVARLLMEAGRALEAYELLDSMLSSRAASVQPPHDAATPDREAAWLLSRAALQLDRHKVADAMLARAGDFGNSAHRSLEPAPFVGSKSCGECHAKIYREQQGESRHALTLRLGADLKDVPLPAHPVRDPVVPSVAHRFTRKADDRIELESRAGSQVIRAIVEYAVGSGRHGITMVAKDMQGIDREVRVSYFAANESWGETKGINFPPRDMGDHIGAALSSSALDRCLACHTTWYRAVDPGRPDSASPERSDRGIGCERCHGPGLNHVKAARSGYADTAIALGTSSPIAVRLKSCVECHAADGSVLASDPEFTRAQGTTFLFSRCYTASKGQFGCTTCHDPHRPVETAAVHFESTCLRCHRGPTGTPSCPVNSTGKCISCHMPRVDDPSRRSRFTDHHIRIHRDQAPARTSRTPIVGRSESPRPLSENQQSAIIDQGQ